MVFLCNFRWCLGTFCTQHLNPIEMIKETGTEIRRVTRGLGAMFGLPETGNGGNRKYNYLSLADVETINAGNNCGGCHGHRWKQIQNLNDLDKRNMHNFGMVDYKMKQKLFVCRGQLNGEWLFGWFTFSDNACHLRKLSRNSEILRMTTNAEVLIFPGHGAISTRWSHLSDTSPGGGARYRYQLVNNLSITSEELEKIGVVAIESAGSDRSYRGYIGFVNQLTPSNGCGWCCLESGNY